MLSEVRRKKCTFCEGDHYTSSCPAYLAKTPAERLAAVRDRKLCLLCLTPGHYIQACRHKWKCQEAGCVFRHHSTLHGSFQLNRATPAAAGAVNFLEQELEDTDRSVNTLMTERETVIFKTVTLKHAVLPITPVIFQGPNGQTASYALLDSGSNSTICTNRVLKKVGAPQIGRAHLSINTVMGKTETDGTVHHLEVKGIEGETFLPIFEAVGVEELPISRRHILTAADVQDWHHLAQLSIPSVESKYVDILIGQDNAHLLTPGKSVAGKSLRDPYAVPTPLGWTIYGFRKKQGPAETSVSAVSVMTIDGEVALDEAVTRFWTVDKVPEKQHLSAVDRGILNYWDTTVKLENGHIVLPIPFKEGRPAFPDNRAAAVVRLQALGRRMERDQELARQMREAMQINFDKKYAERVVDPPLPGLGWHLTCFPVFHPRKPGIARPVFNGKWKYRAVSLNEVVHQGPDLNNRLIDVLVNFRLFKVAFTTDVKAMFNQVLVPPEQRDALRFLWFKDGDPKKEILDYRMTTHLFGGTWSPAATTYAMRKSLDLVDEVVEPEVRKTVDRSFYVDDCLKSVSEIAKGIMQLSRMRAILGKASFELAKVASNEWEVVQSVPEAHRASGWISLELDGGQMHVEHSLGQGWRPKGDVLCFTVNFKLDPVTRREMLSTLSGLFDPLGLCGPALVPGKRLFQELTRRGLDWDDAIPPDVLEQWRNWAAGAKRLEQLEIPRWVGLIGEDQPAMLMHFSDASEVAYGCVTYVCGLDENGRILSAVILMARCKLSPTKTLTIPRLELCGAHMATQTDSFLKKYLDIKLAPSEFWTDSSLVLRYVSSEPAMFKTFVANRVSEILQETTVAQWHFVPGELNPADVLSRGTTATELVLDDSWKFGPSYLLKERDNWPEQPSFMNADLPKTEIKQEKKIYSVNEASEKEFTGQKVSVMTASLTKGEARTPYAELIEQTLEEKSCWMGVLRKVARVKMIVDVWRKKKKGKEHWELDTEDLEKAEMFVMLFVQDRHLTESQKASPLFKKLFPRQVEGLYRVGGRIQRSTYPTEFSHPYVLPAGNRTAELYITHCHNQTFHAGVDRTLMEVRKRAWLLTGRRGVSAVIRKCQLCKRMKGKPMTQFMSDLPHYRIEKNTRPFTNVGLDYMGPLAVKIGRSEVKRWICVVTCSVTRAVHLEPACDLSSSGFLNAFMRFMARRGRPENVLSDNGTNFVGAKGELDKETAFWNEDRVDRFCTDRGIKWRFNPPGASHFGGFWERHMRTFRSMYFSLAQGQKLTDDALNTFACLGEQMMNSRPMTKMSDDPSDPSPLTPNHLLMMKAVETTVGVYHDRDLYKKTWRQVQRLADKFWDRWTHQYLVELQRRNKWYDLKENLKEGNLILLLQENCPRQKWPLGLVTKVFPGPDGLVRAAEVRTQQGTYVRPVAKMVLLEGDLPEKK